MANPYEGQRAVVVGGSIGGLTAALLLRDLGMEVSVFERTPTELDGRGGGIVLQRDTLRWFRERSAQSPEQVSTSSHRLRYLGPDNEILHDEEVEWRFSSWSTFYRALLSDFGRNRYHLGEFACGFSQDDDGVELRFVSGRRVQADLVVFSDGIGSTGRRRLLPDAACTYSGYVGWRGTVVESEVSQETLDLLGDSLTYSVAPNTQIVLYPIPGPNAELEPGRRLLNYVWYRNVEAGAPLEELLTDKRGFLGTVSVHPGQVQDRYIAELKETAPHVLAPAAAEVVLRTAEPYIQPVLDMRASRMAFGRIALMGDAACVARPHAAAGTAKAAVDAWALAAALEDADGDILAALAKWEPGQLQIADSLIDRVTAMGARSQFENTWYPGDPDLRFGLYGPGA